MGGVGGNHPPSQQTRGLHPMLFQCRPTFFDAGTTLKQHCVNASCLLDVNRSLCAPAGRTRFPDICLRGCAYTLLQTVQSHEVYSDAYGTVHYHDYKKNPEVIRNKNRAYSSFCRDIAMIVQKAT